MNNESNTGDRFTFTAEIEKRNARQIHMFGQVRILFRNVRLNGNLLFRDHIWVLEANNLKVLKIGDIIKFEAKIKKYIDIDNTRCFKYGLHRIRIIKKITNRKFKKDNREYIDNIWMKRKIK